MANLESLLDKYSSPSGRYTHYPPAPVWSSANSATPVIKAQEDSDLYLHIPFCESLCTFCGCNIKVTGKRQVIPPYLEALIREWETWHPRRVGSLYLGGGTPNFLAASDLHHLLSSLLKGGVAPDFQGSVEIDPRNVKEEQLDVLRELGITRATVGAQDTSSKVLANVNRKCSFETLARVVEQLNERGFKEIFLELICGLPLQTPKTFARALDLILSLPIHGVILYPLAPVPWQQAGQRAYGDYLPLAPPERNALYQMAVEQLQSRKLIHLGMGQFVSPDCPTGEAFRQGRLRRNIMGHTPKRAPQLIGLGASAMGKSERHLWQNQKVVEKYQYQVKNAASPIERWHRLSDDQVRLNTLFEQIACRERFPRHHCPARPELLRSLLEDEILLEESDAYRITHLGRHFIRSICQAFDLIGVS